MTRRGCIITAFCLALAIQGGMVTVWGTLSEWCFCAVTTAEPSRIPPPFVMRFLELSVAPTSLLGVQMAIQGLFLVGLLAWFVVLLALLNAMVLLARLRIRPFSAARPGDSRRIRLAGRVQVRRRHMLVLGGVLIGMGLIGGMILRARWLAEAERVFSATMAAASTGQPLPAGVRFSMIDVQADTSVYVNPEPGYEVKVDPVVSGRRLLDRFVVPYEYGGRVRSAAGEVWNFDVWRDGEVWGVSLDQYRRPIYR